MPATDKGMMRLREVASKARIPPGKGPWNLLMKNGMPNLSLVVFLGLKHAWEALSALTSLIQKQRRSQITPVDWISTCKIVDNNPRPMAYPSQ